MPEKNGNTMWHYNGYL